MDIDDDSVRFELKEERNQEKHLSEGFNHIQNIVLYLFFKPLIEIRIITYNCCSVMVYLCTVKNDKYSSISFLKII